MVKKVFHYVLTGVVCLAGVVCCVLIANKVYANGSASYAEAITNEIEALRQQIENSETFHNGITVNGVSIGGMTMSEASEALKPVEASIISDVGFELHHEECTLNLTSYEFDISFNTESILSDAIFLAREGELESLQQQIDQIAAEGRSYTIEYTISPKVALIRTRIISMADVLDYPATDASYQPNPDSVYVTDSTYEGIEDPTSLPDYVSPDRFIFVKESNGRKTLVEDALNEVVDRTETRDYGVVEIKTEEIYPTVLLEDIQSNIVLRSHYESSYGRSPYNAVNRVYNIKKACGIVNGTVLPPANPNDPNDGTNVFSANDTLGDRTTELGWLLAPGFIDGGANSKDSPGGGVCHVSSTMYNAVILGDFKVVYRINHSSHVGYVPWGQDATIDTGRIDFKWSNNTEHNVYIFMWVDTDEKNVCCEIWGEPFPETFDSIVFYAELTETIEIGATEYIEKSALHAPYWYIFNSAKVGYKYQSYKQYYLDGKRVGSPVPVAESEYKMHPLRICVWRGFDPSVDELLPEYKIAKPAD